MKKVKQGEGKKVNEVNKVNKPILTDKVLLIRREALTGLEMLEKQPSIRAETVYRA